MINNDQDELRLRENEPNEQHIKFRKIPRDDK